KSKPTTTLPIAGEVLALGLSPDGMRVAVLTARSIEMQAPNPNAVEVRKRAFDVHVWSLASDAITEVRDVLSEIPGVWANRSPFVNTEDRAVVRVSSDGRWVVPGLTILDQHRSESQLAADVWDLNGAAPHLVQRYDGTYPGEEHPGWSRVSQINLS